MSSYYMMMPAGAEAELVTRLRQLIELDSIDVSAAGQAVSAGDICFTSGQGMLTMPNSHREEIARGILGRGAHLVIMPPLPQGPLPSLIHEVESPASNAARFGPVRIIEGELRRRCGLEEMTILFNQVLRVRTGKALVVTSSGEPVVTHFQHRSTWGQIIYMTLLLGSTSTRSRREHRVAFAQGLVSWLAQLSPQTTVMTVGENIPSYSLNYELPVVLMAIQLVQQDGSLSESSLKLEVDRIRSRLAEENREFHFSESLSHLSNAGVLSPIAEGRWKLDPEKLSDEIKRRHLASYLRRLR